MKNDVSPLVERKLAYPEPLSLAWRVNHTLPYVIGGITFVLGSICYIPSISNFWAGGWLFTIGSIGFLYADSNEWSKNNRVGCWAYEAIEESFESAVEHNFQPRDSTYGKFQRAESGLNFGLSILGSTLYLIGAVFFIPATDLILEGTHLFIYGSACIFLSQIWKLYRSACTETNTLTASYRFSIKNLAKDLPMVGVDLCAGLGGFAYLIGSVYFLPEYDLSVADTMRCAVWFIVGGGCFVLSGLFHVYRYFFTLNYYH